MGHNIHNKAQLAAPAPLTEISGMKQLLQSANLLSEGAAIIPQMI